ncbi:MAG: helix-turn-helix domain-containing protein [Candidatus Dormibacteraceae bacterium]
MTRSHLPLRPPTAPPGRRGGARGTGAAAGPPPVAGDEPWLLDSRQVARLLGISRTKAFQLMASTELPVVRIGRCVRVSRFALGAWIHERSSVAPSNQAYDDSVSSL